MTSSDHGAEEHMCTAWLRQGLLERGIYIVKSISQILILVLMVSVCLW